MAKIKFDTTKILGLGAMALSLAATIFSAFADEKKQDAKIAEKVNEAMQKLTDGKDK